jgi:hypothetical protein
MKEGIVVTLQNNEGKEAEALRKITNLWNSIGTAFALDSAHYRNVCYRPKSDIQTKVREDISMGNAFALAVPLLM